MADPKSSASEIEISRDRLAELLNEDLSREYQAIIGYVVYSQVLSGAQYMDIAAQLEIHAKQELDHALIISRQIDYLGKMPTVTAKPVRVSKNPKDMLRFDLDNENDTIRNYRDRIRQIVPQSFMDAIGKTYDNVVPTDFALDSFHTRIFPSRFNWLRGNHMNQIDINIQRTFPISEKTRLEFSTDFINAFNHVQFDNPNADPTSNNFGKVTQQWNTPRWIQFKLRLAF